MNKTNNLSDIFNSNFISNITAVSPVDMIVALALSFIVGMFIMAVYKKTFKGVMYSKTFGISLLALTMISTFIILGVTSNIVLSLGMVGALSIVRFRSAIKEPIDIAFLFWSISEGIILGAGLIVLAIIGAIFIGVILVVYINKETVDNPYILVIRCKDKNAEKNALEDLSKNVKKYTIKSKTASQKNGIELTVEIKMKDMKTEFVDEVSQILGVENAVLVSYNGDYMC